MVAANKPYNKLSNTIFHSFLEKYTGKSIPFEATLRKGYIDDIYNQVSRPGPRAATLGEGQILQIF